MDAIYKKLNVSDQVLENTKEIRENKKFTKFKDTAPPYPNYNLMCDLIELPTASAGYKYLFVICDIAGNGHFDIEPLKNKTPQACLTAMKKIFDRPYVNRPYFSVVSDAGNEFKGVFERFLDEHGIYHKVTVPKRKTQNAIVESLNRVIVRIIFAYLNQKEVETKKVYKNWYPILPIIREDLNKFREKKIEPLTIKTMQPLDLSKKEKFKVGDTVQYKLDTPQTFLGTKNTGSFREGDVRLSKPTTITKVLVFAGLQPYRYLVESNPHASYTESQLRKV
jgi:hypothetical protein